MTQTSSQTLTDAEDLPPVTELHLVMRMRGGTTPNRSAAAVPSKRFRIDKNKQAEVVKGMKKIKNSLANAEGTEIDTGEFCKRVRNLKAVRSIETGKLGLMRNDWVVRFAEKRGIVKKKMWSKKCNIRASPKELAELQRCLEQNVLFPKSLSHLVTADRLFRLKNKKAQIEIKDKEVKTNQEGLCGDRAPDRLPKGKRVKSKLKNRRKNSRPEKLAPVGSHSNDGHLYQGFQSSETAIIFSKVGLKEQLLNFCTRGALGRAHTVHVSLLLQLYDC